jgi:hypothetical protein
MKTILNSLLIPASLAVFLSHTSPAQAERYALLAAVEDYSHAGAPNLPGCSTDLKGMHEMLTGKLGFPSANVRTLINREATKDGVLRELDSLVSKAQPGDSVVFYFSGHGGQVPDYDDDEKEDSLDEALITYDFNPKQSDTWLLDDHLRASLSRIKTKRALVLLDACHAGTGTRSDIVNKRADFGFKSMLGATRSDLAQFNINQGGPDSHVLMAACEANQLSAMGDYDGVKRSLFTTALLNVMPNMVAAPLADLRGSVYQEMQRLHPTAAAEQHPTLEGSINISVNVLIGSGVVSHELTQPNQATPVPAPTDGLPSSFPVQVVADKNEYRSGELLVASVISERPGFLRLYYVDKTGKATLIFPNHYQQDNRIAGRQRIEVGGQTYPFQFRMEAPGGTELLLAAVSEEQFSDHDALNFSKEQPVKDMGQVRSLRELVDTGVKQIRVESRPVTGGSAVTVSSMRPGQIGRAAFIYQVRDTAGL